jgi:hypothetical protein
MKIPTDRVKLMGMIRLEKLRKLIFFHGLNMFKGRQ